MQTRPCPGSLCAPAILQMCCLHTGSRANSDMHGVLAQERCLKVCSTGLLSQGAQIGSGGQWTGTLTAARLVILAVQKIDISFL